MQIDGIHHISTMTSDGRTATDFVTGVLGLRLAAKTVNQDSPDMYHLFFTDEDASAGSDLTMFETRGMPVGRDGAGMVHRISFRVASDEAIGFWEGRLTRYGLPNRRAAGTFLFEDAEGLGFELVVDDSGDPPLRARHPQIPEEVALRGFDGVRMFSRAPERSATVLTDVLGARLIDPRTPLDAALEGGAGTDAALGRHELRSDRRGGVVTVDRAPAERPVHGAGTVHHVAFGVRDADYEAWLPHVERHGLQTSGLVDRFYFRSIYFREPGGVLYELATDLPGFEAKNPREDWGVKTILPPWLEEHRTAIEANLQPIPDPREDW
ncbi:VOC family protein [Patulibacter sp.]|uniref:VOC family protein n=1 Tax=Patulibacter sp. TaxID=1912859 RepID=UPI00271C64B5|nr:VOC family protein [Patulibacter sp.]MDO9409634.1 VOC family protein [Patulibacter sp.]